MKCIHRTVPPFIALVVFVLGATARVEADPIVLAPGTPNQGLVILAVPQTTAPGTLLASLNSLFTIASPTGTITGSLATAVYRNTSDFIDFYYQIVNSTAPGNLDQAISGVTLFNFGSASTAVGYYTNPALFGGLFGTPTLTAEGTRPRTADRTADGNQVTLWFGPPWNGGNKIEPGDISAILLIATNATNYSGGFATVQNHGIATVSAFQPSPVQVPEPNTAIIVLLGSCFGLYRGNLVIKNAIRAALAAANGHSPGVPRQ